MHLLIYILITLLSGFWAFMHCWCYFTGMVMALESYSMLRFGKCLFEFVMYVMAFATLQYVLLRFKKCPISAQPNP